MLTAGAAQARMAALPFAGLDTILGGRDPLILAPHPDDESLGCGGLLAACAAERYRPAVFVLTDGTGSHPGSRAYPPARLRAVREAEAAEAVSILGLARDRLSFLRLRDTGAPVAGPEFAAAVESVIAATALQACTLLLAPWRHDPHGDHLAAYLIAAEAARRTGCKLLAYPVWGWTLPRDTLLDGPPPAGWRLDISPHLAAKRRAIAAHRSQHGDLVTDDPTGFRLPPHLLARFDLPFETFLTEEQIEPTHVDAAA
jgi:LmbE family N-acetylglucosaminyl deacetylase